MAIRSPIFQSLLAGLLSLGMAFSPSLGEEARKQVPLKVGVLLSLSGGLEQWCGYIREGIELAAAEAGYPVALVYEDDRSIDRRTMVTATTKLISHDQVHVIGTWSNSGAAMVSKVTERQQVPFIFAGFDNRVAGLGPATFGAFINYPKVYERIADFIFRVKGKKRLAIVMAEDEWSQGFQRPLIELAAKYGASVVATEIVAVSSTDLRSTILRFKREEADAVVAPLYGASLYAFLRQLRELQYTPLIHVGDGMFEEDIRVVGDAAEGVFASQMYVEDPSLYQSYQKKFGREISPLGLGMVVTGYVLIKHLRAVATSIAEQGGSLSRESFLRAVQVHRTDSVIGPVMLGAPPEEAGEDTVVVRGGQYQLVK